MWWPRRRGRTDDDFSAEVEAHVALEIDRLIAEGMTPEEARAQARRAFGNVTRTRERFYESRRLVWLDELRQDVRYALRSFGRTPGFTAAAVLTLALGIGANTAIFTLVDALMLRSLPVRDPQALLQISMAGRDAPPSPLSDSLSYPVVRALADQTEIFAGVGAFSASTFDAGPPERVQRTPGAYVTGAFFDTLGLEPVAGRLLTREDDEPGAPLVAVITDGYWERTFGRDPRIVGQPYTIHGRSVIIVGVSPPGFTGAQVGWIADITLPVSSIARITPELAGLLGPGNVWLRALARPRPGVSSAQAQARLQALWPQLSSAAVAPTFSTERRAGIENAIFTMRPGGTGWTSLRDLFRRPLYVLTALVGLVLLIACANVSGLLLARATVRQREIAVRFAVGAERGRIVRQLLTESGLLSLAGAVLGIQIAWMLSRFLVNLLSTGPLDVTFDLTPNGHVLAFTSGLAMATVLLFGLAPAWRATAAGPGPVLKATAVKMGVRDRLLPSVVTAQVALCLLLLVGAGLFIRTLQNLRTLDPGFEHEGVLLVDVAGQRPMRFYKDAVDAIRRLPGVQSVSVAMNTPLSGAGWSETVLIEGQPQDREPNFVAVSPGYFATLRTPTLRGRDFTLGDEVPPADVAIVNEVFARRYFPNQDPLGQSFSARTGRLPAELEIVGVVKDVVANQLRGDPPPTVYVSYFQVQVPLQNFSTLQVRATGSLAHVAAAIRRDLQPRMTGSPVEIRPLTSQVAAAIVQERLMATLASGFGVLALVLAAVGLYGLLAYRVAACTRDIGIRMALGADRGEVLSQVMRQGVRLVLVGILLGIAAAAGLTRYVEGMLFGLTPLDPATFIAVSVLFTVVALLASYLPARRATKVDPLVALRYE
jgi:predicted permease